MAGRKLRGAVVGVVALAPAFVSAPGASATTFCVPGFHSACPNSGGNVAQANLQTAMQTSGDDTVADRIVIAAGTINTNSNSYELDSGDNDDLEIVGAGPDTTAITNSGTGNEFMMDLLGGRDVTVRDLTLRVPASFPDGGGGALQAEQDTFVNVDFESRNPGSDGLRSAVGGSLFTDGRVYGSAGGTIDTAFAGNGAETGELRIERTTIENASWGVLVDDVAVVTRVRRTKIVDPVAYGLRMTTGAFAVMENSIITVDDGYAISAKTDSVETLLFNVRHTTILDTGGDDDPIIDVGDGFTPTTGTINAVISDSIIAGNEDPLNCDSPMSNTTLTMRYSWFFHSATVNGNCSVPTIQTLDSFDSGVGPPQFLGPADFHLPASSPAIDRGDPLTVTLPTEDFDGAPRPVDGDGDGDARRDIGAYEYQPPVPESPATPSGGPAPRDNDPPQTTIGRELGKALPKGTAKLRFRSSEAGSTFTCKLDKRKAVRCNSPKTYRGLKPGKHRFKVWATDAAGNKDPTPAKRAFRVPTS